ncbi:TPR-like protein [Rhizoclosmatium globosum]|uniref:Outer dynein arm-docking complex subunit 4 n=1 Tax=Rhizoclosmatium globosum TaxID=329046 RepID=A0A1Y2BQ04_9FUNG|nr:Tetratricopeptide repeat protein 25 [Rhizoclosmatium sp. JEL0117]ORY36824.1 TPR-like protein [Rhizoclosmatium globosum]|eukprot:ORY36824.1 TPR-like protein [Rhizoclosmatium globosum]
MPDKDDNSEGDPHENLVAKFQTLSAEGDLLAQRRAFTEAIEVFSQALDIRPTDKHCLVSRSKCYIHVGSPALALDDANTSLKDEPLFFKGIFQKAEALYAMGDFELALMFYHRGNRLRPELDEFRIGIQKSREAIENSIGKNDKPKDFKIEISTKLRKNLGTLFQTTSVSHGGSGVTTTPGARPPSTPATQAAIIDTASGKAPHSKVESKLLGELYEDKLYLQNLILDRDFVDFPDDQIFDFVNEGLRYLGTRLEFWRQQNPLYARKKEKKIKPRMERGRSTAHHRLQPLDIPAPAPLPPVPPPVNPPDLKRTSVIAPITPANKAVKV